MGALKCHQNILVPILIETCVFTKISNAFWYLKVSNFTSEILLTCHLTEESTILKIQEVKGLSPDWWWTLFNKRKSLCHNRIGNFWVRESTVVKPTGSYMNYKHPGLKEIRSCQGQNCHALRQRSWADWQRRYSKLSSVLERSKAES